MKNRIRELRQEFSMSTLDLAEKLGLSERTINNYENGKRDPSTNTLLKICEIFNCSLDYLMYKSNIKNIEEYNELLLQAIEKGLTKKDLNTIIEVWIKASKKNQDLN
jgi:DNA-binding XRE family transcriptional regulator